MKRLLVLLFGVMLLAVAASTVLALKREAGGVFNGMKYTVSGDTVTITGYTDELPEDLEIPMKIDGKTVQAIAGFAFENSPLKKVMIPLCVTSIGDGVFYGSKSLESIGTPFDIPFNGEYIGDGCVLMTKDGKKLIAYAPAATDDSHLENKCYTEEIAFGACKGVKLENGGAVLPNAHTVAPHAFEDTSMGSCHFSSMKHIGESVFEDAVFEKLYVEDVEKVDSRAFAKAKGEIHWYGDAPECAEDAFDGCDLKIYYDRNANGWDEFDFAGVTLIPSDPIVHKVSFYQDFAGAGQTDEPYAVAEVYDGMTLTNETIPPLPEVEDYSPIQYCNDHFMPIFEDTVFVIPYTDISYKTVTFVDGVTNEVIDEVQVRRHSSVEPPEPPVHEYYNFDRWYPNVMYEILEDVTITATYKKVSFNAAFTDSLTGEVFATQRVPALEDNTEFPTPPEHKGYTFTGWSDDGKYFTADRVIYALYELELGDVSIGDANTDGKVDTADAVHILKYCANVVWKLSYIQEITADVNHDGKVNTADATLVLKYAAGMIDPFR